MNRFVRILILLPLAWANPALAADTIRCAFPFWFGFAPVFVAQDLGYFEEQGLEVTTVFDNDRANVLPAIDSGDLDCTMRTIGEYMSRPRSATTSGTVIGTIDVSVGADGVVAGPEIKSVKDLVGKIFAGEINHPGTVMTQHALAREGLSMDDIDMRLIATDDSVAIFEDTEIAAVATWEPMMSTIVKNTARTGSHILLSSKDFGGLITDVIIVRTEDLKENPQKYASFLRGIYRAIDLYGKDPDKFIAMSAPKFGVDDAEMKESLAGVQYTTFENSVEFLGQTDQPGTLQPIFDSLNDINVKLELQEQPLTYADHIDASVQANLFDGNAR